MAPPAGTMNTMQSRRQPSNGPLNAVIRWRGRAYAIAEAVALAFQEQGAGRLPAALDIYDLIIAKVPNAAVVHINRGVTLQAMKRYEAALASFDRAIALNPAHAEAYNNRGAVLQKINRPAEALASYDQAIALKPGYANAHHNRAAILKAMNRYDEALAGYDQAIALNPAHAEAYNNRGIILQEMKRYPDALASFDRAIALNPAHAIAYNNRGLNLVIKGDMAAAEQMFRKAAALKPDFPDPLFNLANIRKYQNADNAEVKSIHTLLDRPGISTEEKEHLYFSLGKIYDDSGRYEEAFEYYRRANQLRNATVAYDPDEVVRMTDSLMEVFSPEFLARPAAFASASRSPLFIVGMPGSGTTLLANILSNHPSIGTAGELPTLMEFTARLPALNGNGIPYPQAVTQLTPAVAAALINEYEQRLRRDLGSDIPHVIDKNPLNFKQLGFIALLFPNARIIHCVRHPWDTCLSNYFRRFPVHLNYSFDLRNIGHFYAEYARLMAHWRKVPALKMIEVSYEDMVANTEPMTRRTLEFLELEWNERCLAPHTNPCMVETASQWQVRQPIYTQALGRWRHYEKQLAPLKAVLPPPLAGA